ncbi:hypothetical protein FLK61_26015 [Paenalkalicoccus suaedae]|uniref:Uncharacterized protein n=1 Tax=Paenalkalicoccus suaedae TaxID=2592382 RepID=A0A859FB79_9BACI|nr:hypothetical protein [Paenalkalicoccus suaedae]QKS70220.1 hypothetical protein FLK61_26015 [Paenalkalicoccus suaedae]
MEEIKFEEKKYTQFNHVSGVVRVFCGTYSQVNSFFIENPDLEIQDMQMSSGSPFPQIMVIYLAED